ncbi:hypothetical protein [Pseudomonas fluorescens]|jgi:hypothetical protein|uniref:hypothetical protein n=1 Tax=Pseudomonas fluorescens TaxID=294 RepID=UPI0011CD9E20|nr:hypothetical protein [Pseudomonas fluorescens]
MSISQLELELIEELSNYKLDITNYASEAWRRCDFSLSEPNLVKSFAMGSDKGVHYLNSTLAAVFNSAQNRFVMKFAAAFTHQRPYVKRLGSNVASHKGTNNTEQCELADLGFFSVFVDSSKQVIASRSTFFQAKKDDRIDNLTQQWLYDFDGGFEYVHTSFWALTDCVSPNRDFPAWSEGRSTAFQYLLLLSNNQVKVRLSPWKINHCHDFGFFFYRLLTLGAGISYRPAESKKGEWSSIVNDVLRMAGGHMAGKDRGSIDLDKVVDYFNDFRSHDKYFSEPPKEGGMPMVLAIIQDTLRQAGD